MGDISLAERNKAPRLVLEVKIATKHYRGFGLNIFAQGHQIRSERLRSARRPQEKTGRLHPHGQLREGRRGIFCQRPADSERLWHRRPPLPHQVPQGVPDLRPQGPR